MLPKLPGKEIGVVVSMLLCAAILSTSSHAYAQDLMEYSQEFRSLVREIQRLYLHPKGWSLKAMESEAPATVAAVMGHALRQQALRLGVDYAQDGRYMRLEDEVFSYLSQVAGRSGYIDEHGNRISTEDLWDIAYHHIEGNRDRDIEQFFGVVTGQMPSVLGVTAEDDYTLPEIAEDAEPWPPPGAPAGIEFVDDESSISLLGVTLDQPTSVPGEEDLKRDKPARKWKYDDIIGSWQCQYATLAVTKEGKKYIGVCTGAPDPAKAEEWLGWRVGEKAFEVEPGYESVGGPVYDGLGWHSGYTRDGYTRSWGNVYPRIFASENPASDSLGIWDVTNGDTWLWRMTR